MEHRHLAIVAGSDRACTDIGKGVHSRRHVSVMPHVSSVYGPIMSWLEGHEFREEFDDLRDDPEGAARLSAELRQEVGPGHHLYGKSWLSLLVLCRRTRSWSKSRKKWARSPDVGTPSGACALANVAPAGVRDCLRAIRRIPVLSVRRGHRARAAAK